MRALFTALVVALAVGGAAAAQQPPASAAQAQAQAEDELGRLVARVKPAVELQEAAVNLLVKSIDLVDPALALAERRAPKREIDAWIQSWEPTQKQRISELRAQLNALRPLQAKDYPLVLTISAAQGIEPNMLLESPNRVRELALATLATTERITNDLKLGASGNQTALERLVHNLVTGPMALIESENAAMQVSIASLPRAHPQRSLMSSFVDANVTILDLMKALDEELNDRTVDHKAVAARMRAHIGEGRKHTDEAADLADDFLKSAERDPQAATPFGQKVLASYRSYKESAAVERQIYDYLEGITAKVESGGDLADAVEETDGLDKLVDKRGALQLQRINALGR